MTKAIYAPAVLDRSMRSRLIDLGRRSDAKGLVQLSLHLGLLVATGTLVWLLRRQVWLLPALVAHGIVLVFLFGPLHESIHRTAFASRRLNDAVAWVCGALLVLPPQYFRAFHFSHHRHTQDPDLDPELITAKPTTRRQYLRHASGLPYWRERLTTTLRHARGHVTEPFVSARAKPGIVREARILLAAYLVLAAGAAASGSVAPVILWIVPALLGQPFLRLYLLAEHTGCPLVANMLANSRTTRSLALVRRLAWNMPFHAEHHAHPALPFHALPAAHALLQTHIKVQAPGYVAVHRDILNGLDR